MSVCRHCDTPHDGISSDCYECGRPIGSRPIEVHRDQFTIWRGEELPPFCVRCGAPERSERWKRSYYWHEPALYLLVFAGLLVYVIAAVLVRKRIDLDVPICEAHWQRRRKLQKVAIGLLVLMVGLVVLAIATNMDSVGPFACPGAFLAGVAALIVHSVAERSLRPKRITDDWGEFAGASPEFLVVLS